MKRHSLIAILAILLALTSLSCSKGVSGPTTPDLNPQANSLIPASPKHVWGMWDIGIDTASGRIDIIPLRNAEFKANVTMFLQPPAGKITNMGICLLYTSDAADE